jgi:hypothetical protein
MPKKAKLSLTERGHARPPDFSIPLPGARHHDAAAQHYGEAARHQRQAAKLHQIAQDEKACDHALLAPADPRRKLRKSKRAPKLI